MAELLTGGSLAFGDG